MFYITKMSNKNNKIAAPSPRWAPDPYHSGIGKIACCLCDFFASNLFSYLIFSIPLVSGSLLNLTYPHFFLRSSRWRRLKTLHRLKMLWDTLLVKKNLFNLEAGPISHHSNQLTEIPMTIWSNMIVKLVRLKNQDYF